MNPTDSPLPRLARLPPPPITAGSANFEVIMAKKHGLTWWKSKAWDQFSKWVRLRDAIKTTGTKTHLVCCTCGKIYPAFGKGCAQAGHYVPGRTHILLYEERGVHGQCYNCNHTLKGNPQNYRDFMIQTYGLEETTRIEQSRFNHLFKYRTFDLEEIRDKYKALYEELEKEKS